MPGAPGEATRVIASDKAVDLSQVQFIGADIKFMQGMIGHHTQAVEMVALVPSRSGREDVRSLAHRIDLSQQDEIKMMQSWLQSRGQPVPAPGAMHVHGATLMPGMLTEEEMAKLAEAKGDDFDRLFLLGMIKHHSGALTMVARTVLQPRRGAGGGDFRVRLRRGERSAHGDRSHGRHAQHDSEGASAMRSVVTRLLCVSGSARLRAWPAATRSRCRRSA